MQSDSSCSMQPDPKDPLCCKVPVCTPRPDQTTPQYQTIPTRVIDGGLGTVTPSPRPNPTPDVKITPVPVFTPYPLPTLQTPSTWMTDPTPSQKPIYQRKYYINA